MPVTADENRLGPPSGFEIDDVRHAASEQRPREHAEHPARMREHVKTQFRARPDREAETRSGVVLAVGSDRHVRSQHQYVEARVGHPLDRAWTKSMTWRGLHVQVTRTRLARQRFDAVGGAQRDRLDGYGLTPPMAGNTDSSQIHRSSTCSLTGERYCLCSHARRR